MQYLKHAGLAAALTVTAMSCQPTKQNAEATLITSPQDSLSYSVGVAMASGMNQQLAQAGLDTINKKLMVQAIKDVFDSSDLAIEQAASEEFLQAYMMKQQAAQQAQQDQKGQATMMASQQFLEQNKNKEGITVTASGLQYEVLKEGTGISPDANDEVTVHYHGTLPTGEVFDSSVDRGEPATFPLNGVIPGWTEGVQLMKKGAKYRFYIPSDLAYGPRGAGQMIGPNQALVFDVELLEVNPK